MTHIKRPIAVIAALGFLVASQGAAAAVHDAFGYSESMIWRCAVRFLRVDRGYEIVEKDRDAGYVLFAYTGDFRTSTGSLEVLPVPASGMVRVQINIPGQPAYIERLLLKKLATKLKTEYGAPVLGSSAERTAPAPAPDDTAAPDENAETDERQPADEEEL